MNSFWDLTRVGASCRLDWLFHFNEPVRISCQIQLIQMCYLSSAMIKQSNALPKSETSQPATFSNSTARLNVSVSAVSSAWNIGAVLDEPLTVEEHVSCICKSAYYHLRNIAMVRKYLTQDATATLIHALVISWIDNFTSHWITWLPSLKTAKKSKPCIQSGDQEE